MSINLERKSTMGLLMDIIYEAEAQKCPDLLDVSTLQLSDKICILERRYGQNFFGNSEMCYLWFTGPDSPLNTDEKRKLIRIIELKEGKRDFSIVFNEILAEKIKGSKKNE